jgi:transposase
MPVIIGVDPHKASHSAAALDQHGQLVGHQRVLASLDGYQALRRWAGRWPSGWSATANRSWTCRPSWPPGSGSYRLGTGRKSDPDDAVSVAIAARHAPSVRPVGVEDQAAVLHLLTKRRQDLVAARTQTINRLHRLLMDLVPGGARRNLTANRAAVLLAAVTPLVRRRSPAGSWPASSWLTCAAWSSGSPRSRCGSGPWLPRPTPAWSTCSAWDRSWPPPSWVRSATLVGSRASITSPPTPAPPPWRPPVARSSATGCHGPVTASSTTPCT